MGGDDPFWHAPFFVSSLHLSVLVASDPVSFFGVDSGRTRDWPRTVILRLVRLHQNMFISYLLLVPNP